MQLYSDLVTNPLDPTSPVSVGTYGSFGPNDPLTGQGISAPGEVDFIPVFMGQFIDYIFGVSGESRFGQPLNDPFLMIFDNQFRLLASADDQNILGMSVGKDPLLEFKAPYTGTYFLAITDFTGGTGEYTLAGSFAGFPMFP